MTTAAAIPLTLGATQAATSAYGAYSQNRDIKRSIGSARDAGEVELEQLGDAAELERRKRASESALIRSRLRVLAAESGFDATGSWAALERQVDIDEQINMAVIRRNEFNQRRRVASGLSAEFQRLSAGFQNPLSAAFAGGMGGYATGLQIKSGLDELNRPMPGSLADQMRISSRIPDRPE